MFLRNCSIAGLTALGILTATGPAAAQDPVELTVASFRAGSSWFVYSATIGEILRDALPEGSTIDTPPLGGGHANVRLVGAGQADIALSHAMTNRWAAEGIVAYDAPIENIRALMGGLDTYFLNVTAAGAEPGTTVSEYFTEVNPEAVIGLNPPGSVATFAGELLLAEAGASKDELEATGGRYSYIPIPDTTSGFADGTVDATPQMITIGHPMTTEISQTSDVVQLTPSPELLTTMTEKYGFGTAVLPAGSFRGQDDEITLPSSTTTLIASAEMSDDLAYTIVKALVENAERLAAGHGALADFDPENAWRPEVVNLPLHPGAERYFQERGWMD
ncbi:TAXI family TRAP transporter solute-binding subunit [Psychromarinibacter sp. S121]|uniref:TAXI family TRAP transporter solute-binding subunit n=1 Tax=Psychromarinibacter sp. S121 TaxID=3415127 RepID=UPI003C7E4AAB